MRQPHSWLYLSAEHEDELRRILEAKPVESGENLIVLVPADDGVFLFEERASERRDERQVIGRISCRCAARPE